MKRFCFLMCVLLLGFSDFVLAVKVEDHAQFRINVMPNTKILSAESAGVMVTPIGCDGSKCYINAVYFGNEVINLKLGSDSSNYCQFVIEMRPYYFSHLPKYHSFPKCVGSYHVDSDIYQLSSYTYAFDLSSS